MIKLSDLITDRLPKLIMTPDPINGDQVNTVLALHSHKIYCDSNRYIPRWAVVNVAYYNAHPDEFDGWIGLESIDDLEDVSKRRK